MSGLAQSSIGSAGRLEALARGALPCLSVLLLVCVDLTPLPSPAPTAIAPLLSLCGIFFWSIERPDLLNNALIFVLTIILDATGGLPLGLTAFALFTTRLVLLAPPRFLAGRSFLVAWACFCPAVVLLLTLRWLLASLYFEHLLAFQPTAFVILLTIAAYPLVSLLLARLQPCLPRIAHAASRS